MVFVDELTVSGTRSKHWQNKAGISLNGLSENAVDCANYRDSQNHVNYRARAPVSANVAIQKKYDERKRNMLHCHETCGVRISTNGFRRNRLIRLRTPRKRHRLKIRVCGHQQNRQDKTFALQPCRAA